MPRGDFGFPGFGDLPPVLPSGPAGPRVPGAEQGEGEGDAVQKQQALGSGFLIDAQGHVVTNAHVVEDADRVKVNARGRPRVPREGRRQGRAARGGRAQARGPSERSARHVARIERGAAGRRVRRRDRKSVRSRQHRDHGHRQRQGTDDRRGSLRRLHPDRREHQPGQQRRAAHQPEWPGGRHQHRHQPAGQRGSASRVPIDAVRDVVPQLLATGHVSRGRLGVVIQGMDEGPSRRRSASTTRTAPSSKKWKPRARPTRWGSNPATSSSPSTGTTFFTPRIRRGLVARHAPGTQVKLAVLRDHQKLGRRHHARRAQGRRRPRRLVVCGACAPVRPTARRFLGIGIAEEDGHVGGRPRRLGRAVGSASFVPATSSKRSPGQRVASASDLASKVFKASAAGKARLARQARGAVAVRRHRPEQQALTSR